jgi:hypothetical protein
MYDFHLHQTAVAAAATSPPPPAPPRAAAQKNLSDSPQESGEERVTQTRPFLCEVEGCRRRFKLEEGLRDHMKDAHSEAILTAAPPAPPAPPAPAPAPLSQKSTGGGKNRSPPQPQAQQPQSKNPLPSPSFDFICDLCGSSFRSQIALTSHLNFNHSAASPPSASASSALTSPATGPRPRGGTSSSPAAALPSLTAPPPAAPAAAAAPLTIYSCCWCHRNYLTSEDCNHHMRGCQSSPLSK